MSLKVCALASGSKGNCYYIGDEHNSILVDAGISYSEIKRRLALIDVRASDITAIINTHSHIDHIAGIDGFLANQNVQLFSHYKGEDCLKPKLKNINSINYVTVDSCFYIGDICIMPMEISHDVPCVGYVLSKNGKKISIVTDLGYTNNKLINNITNSDIVYIESNYDETMLKCGKYPPIVKGRILSEKGHLSNSQCADLCLEILGNNLKRIVLSHISQNNNTQALAYKNIMQAFMANGITTSNDFKVDIAYQDKISTMYKII